MTYELSKFDFVTQEHPLDYYGPSIRALPDSGSGGPSPHGEEITISDRERVFDGVPEGMQHWAWSMLRRFMPEHDTYLRKKNRPMIKDPVKMPKPSDLEAAMGKRKIPNEVDAAWDIEKWLERQVKQLAQFYPNPKQNLSLTTTEAIFEHAMEPGERVTALQTWAEKENGLMESVIEKYRDTIIPALVLLIQAVLSCQITIEQRNEHNRILEAKGKYDMKVTFSKWIQPMVPVMKAAGWTWEQKETFITNRLPLVMAGHNSLANPKDLPDFTSKIQNWCVKYASLLKEDKSKTASISNLESSSSDHKFDCSLHGKNGSHNTDQCRALNRKRKKEDSTNGNRDQYCSLHGKNATAECRAKKAKDATTNGTGRDRTISNITSNECLRCLGPHRRAQCTENSMIAELMKRTKKQAPIDRNNTCSRCDGKHTLMNCPVTNEMINVYKACNEGQVSLNNVQRTESENNESSSISQPREIIGRENIISYLNGDGNKQDDSDQQKVIFRL